MQTPQFWRLFRPETIQDTAGLEEEQDQATSMSAQWCEQLNGVNNSWFLEAGV